MIKYYKDFLLEKSISNDRAKRYDTVLQNLDKTKETKSFIIETIFTLQEELSSLKEIKFHKYDEDSNIIYLSVRYNSKIKHLIEDIEYILSKSENLEETYHKYVYPDGEEKSFYPEIEIEKNNFNRIHIPDGLPFILKNIGFGKKIYINLIKKYNYLSSNYLDRSMDSLYVWNSIRKEKNIYTFIFNQKILCINPDLDFHIIEDILLKYYNTLSDEHILIDDDFKEKYRKQILKSTIVDIYKYEINQEINQEKHDK